MAGEPLNRLDRCGRSRHRPWQRLVLRAIPNRACRLWAYENCADEARGRAQIFRFCVLSVLSAARHQPRFSCDTVMAGFGMVVAGAAGVEH